MAVDLIAGVSNLVPSSVGLNSIDDQSSQPEVSFGDYLQSALTKVSDLEKQSNQLKTDFAAGKTDNITDVLIASEKATVALQYTMQIRNKILDAYSEIMRMQI
jgi:flagellar hook-basal body complex protein FliE